MCEFSVFFVEPLNGVTDPKTLRARRIELVKLFLRYKREFFKTALSAADPIHAFENAVCRIEESAAAGNARYSAAQFGRDLQTDKSGSGGAGAGGEKMLSDCAGKDCGDRQVFIECFLTGEENDFLKIIVEAEKISLDAAIGRAISAFAEIVTAKGGEK